MCPWAHITTSHTYVCLDTAVRHTHTHNRMHYTLADVVLIHECITTSTSHALQPPLHIYYNLHFTCIFQMRGRIGAFIQLKRAENDASNQCEFCAPHADNAGVLNPSLFCDICRLILVALYLTCLAWHGLILVALIPHRLGMA